MFDRFLNTYITAVANFLIFLLFYNVGNMAKGRISKRVFQENKAHQIRMCVYQGLRNVRFFGNLACFVFLKQPF